MNAFSIVKDIKYGESPASMLPIHMELRDFVPDPDSTDILYRVVFSGPVSANKERRDACLFGAIRMGLAGFRQILRHIQKGSPGVKFYDEIDGKLTEQSVDDLFWTHDCVPENRSA